MMWWRVGSSPSDRGSDGDGLAGADVTGDHAERRILGRSELMRATASAWASRVNSWLAGMFLPNGVRVETEVGDPWLRGS